MPEPQSYPVRFIKMDHLATGIPHKGLIKVTQSKVELSSQNSIVFSCSPKDISIPNGDASSFNLKAPDGLFTIQPGNSWLSGGKLAWFSKNVRTTTRQLVSALLSAGIELPPLIKSLAK